MLVELIKVGVFFSIAWATLYVLAYINLVILNKRVPQLVVRKYYFKFIKTVGLYFSPKGVGTWKNEKIFDDAEIKLILRWQLAFQFQFLVVGLFVGIKTAGMLGWE